MLCHLEKRIAKVRKKKFICSSLPPKNPKLKAGMGEVSNKDRKKGAIK